jgi:hypothetical protein
MEMLTKCIQKQRDSYYLSLVEPLLVALVLEDSMALPTLAPTPAVKSFTLATKVLWSQGKMFRIAGIVTKPQKLRVPVLISIFNQ